MANAFLYPGDHSMPSMVNPKSYDEYSRIIGGMLEYVHLRDDVGVYVNENGQMLDLPHNVDGSFAMKRIMGEPHGTRWLDWNGYVRGPVLFIGPADEDGNTTSLSTRVFDELRGEVQPNPW